MDATNYAVNPAVTVGSGAETAQGEIIRYQHENAMVGGSHPCIRPTALGFGPLPLS